MFNKLLIFLFVLPIIYQTDVDPYARLYTMHLIESKPRF